MKKQLTFGIPFLIMLGLFVTVFWGCKKEKLATITTLITTEITDISAKSGGNISNDGGGEISSRGLVWATYDNPSVDQYQGITAEGSGSGLFTSNITNLLPGTSYYVRAFATNSAGTAYGQQESFITNWARDTQTQVVVVTNPVTGKTWMDRNLGASRVATSSTDVDAYGDLYQWGRASDGHHKRTSGITSILSSYDTPGHGSFILATDSLRDWRSPQNNNLWQGVNGVNNPCPPGFRLPTDDELNAERLSWSSNDAAGAFASSLKWSLAGFQHISNGSLHRVGSRGYYWSNTVDGTSSWQLYFLSENAQINSNYRAYGFSVRCIRD